MECAVSSRTTREMRSNGPGSGSSKTAWTRPKHRPKRRPQPPARRCACRSAAHRTRPCSHRCAVRTACTPCRLRTRRATASSNSPWRTSTECSPPFPGSHRRWHVSMNSGSAKRSASRSARRSCRSSGKFPSRIVPAPRRSRLPHRNTPRRRRRPPAARKPSRRR